MQGKNFERYLIDFYRPDQRFFPSTGKNLRTSQSLASRLIYLRFLTQLL